jgi:aspartate/methionine/tyrosine aminotransferase
MIFMDKIAKEMNEIIKTKASTFFAFLSDFGKNTYMPKGIILQSQEAVKLATRYNATIGIAREKNSPMYLESLKKYFNDLTPAELFPYAPPAGIPELRKKWQEKTIAENSLEKDKKSISLPVVTQALTNGLMYVGDLFLNPGDELLIPDKLWENYNLMYEVRYRAVIKNYESFNSSLTGFNTEALDKALHNVKKDKIILVFNFPNNPTGYSLTVKEADETVNIVAKYAEMGKKILVITDDAYYGLAFEDNILPGSIFAKFVGLHPNIAAVKLDAFTKEFYVWGFRVGFMTFGDYWQNSDAYAALEQKLGSAIRSSISNCAVNNQYVLYKLLSGIEYKKEKEEKYKILKQRALKVKEVVYKKEFSDCWDVYPFNSGYFMCIRIKGATSEQVRQHALKNYGVGTIAFGETDLRVAFSSIEADQAEDLFNILAKSIRELKG